jgi:hypothetical protein
VQPFSLVFLLTSLSLKEGLVVTHITTSMLDPFIACCVGRHNDHAFQVSDGHYVRTRNELTYEELFWHLQGSQTLGTYVINEDNCCSFAVFDSDTPTGLLDLAAIQLNLEQLGLASYLECSRRGAHLWVFFASPIPATQVRAWLLPFCPPGAEFYPKQDQASFEHPGSVIRLPLGVHRRSGERYPFVTLVDGQPLPLFSSVVDALRWFSTIQRAPVPSPSTILVQRENGGQPTQHNISFKKPQPTTTVGVPSTIREWCASQDPLTVIGRYVSLDGNGLGCCPFGWHHNDGVDSHPSFVAYHPSFPDICCWYCYTWQQGGSLFDFLRFYYGLEPRQLWHRLLSGARF